MKIIHIENYNQFLNFFNNNTIDYIIINISASWCKPCNEIKEELNEFIDNLIIENTIFLKIDYDLLEEEQDFYKYLQPNKIPYFYIFKDKSIQNHFQTSNMEIIKKNITTEIIDNNNNNFDLSNDF
jgi:thiol-disulfide isomerase/thioredoxin